MIGIICMSPEFSAADQLHKAFLSQGIDSVLLYKDFDPYGRITGLEEKTYMFTKQNKEFWFEELSGKYNHMIISCSAMFYQMCGQYPELMKWFCKKAHAKPTVIMSGTMYRRHHKEINRMLDELKIITRLASPELVPLGKNVPYLLCHEYNNIDATKPKKPIVCFSPGLGRRDKRKGTGIVEKGIELAKQKVDFDFDMVIGMTHKECLARKAKAHIFIDQIRPDIGDVGKNGFEALALDCVVLCSVENFEKQGLGKFYPTNSPFINIVDTNTLSATIVHLLGSKTEYEKALEISRYWKPFIGYKNTVDYFKHLWERQ